MRLRQLIASRLSSFEFGERAPHSIVYTDTFKAYNALEVSDLHHLRINHSKMFADSQDHISGIKPDNLYWLLKECEWRFNGGDHKYRLKQLKYGYKSTKHLSLTTTATNKIMDLLQIKFLPAATSRPSASNEKSFHSDSRYEKIMQYRLI